MNFKIITIPETQTQVCLHRDCSEDGKEIVRISSFVNNTAGVELMIDTEVQFMDAEFARSFVDDYSENSAKAFLRHYIADEGIRVGCEFNLKLYREGLRVGF
jgi:hypothetical protein